MIEFLKGVCTPLFLASIICIIIAGGAPGGFAIGYYAASAVLFIADIIDCHVKEK
jgi:hypothetical protein